MPAWSKILMNFDRNLDHEEIDEFLELLELSTCRRLRKLKEECDSLTEEAFEDSRDLPIYQERLAEQSTATKMARDLGGQLSIIALYKKVEAQTSRVVKKRIPSAASKNLHVFKKLCGVLPFDIRNIDGFQFFNELRLLNNSIKHGGVVSEELASAYPLWVSGARIESIANAYERLLPGVEAYMFDLVTQLYSTTSSVSITSADF